MVSKKPIFILTTIALLLFVRSLAFTQIEVPTILGIVNDNNLKNYSYNFCRYSRNEIFARMGYVFKSKDLDLYFSAQPWYKKRTSPHIFLTDKQKQFIELFKAIEKHTISKNNKSILLDDYPVFIIDLSLIHI